MSIGSWNTGAAQRGARICRESLLIDWRRSDRNRAATGINNQSEKGAHLSTVYAGICEYIIPLSLFPPAGGGGGRKRKKVIAIA